MAKPKVLIVDDVNLMLELEKSLLRFSPVRVFTARNGEEALELVRSERPDLVYMDLNMPKMNGVDCCIAIKSDPELRDTPVIMVTTAGKPEDQELCARAGCDGYITKPVDRRLFLEIGRRYIPDIDRREQRIPFSLPVTCRTEQKELTGTTTDISVGGLYLAIDHGIAREESVEIAITIPGGGAPVRARGRVAWLNGVDGKVKPRFPSGFGIEFMDISPKDLEQVREFVESLANLSSPGGGSAGTRGTS